MSFRGTLQVYTGSGKGKSTAAFGLALRARGAGLSVAIIQFIKNKPCAEIPMLRSIGISVQQFGNGLMRGRKVTEEDIAAVRLGLQETARRFNEASTDVLILDEINVALSRDLANEATFHDLLDKRPLTMEVVCTGRGAPGSLIQRADLVTEMCALKHYYQSGLLARSGIEM